MYNRTVIKYSNFIFIFSIENLFTNTDIIYTEFILSHLFFLHNTPTTLKRLNQALSPRKY